MQYEFHFSLLEPSKRPKKYLTFNTIMSIQCFHFPLYRSTTTTTISLSLLLCTTSVFTKTNTIKNKHLLIVDRAKVKDIHTALSRMSLQMFSENLMYTLSKNITN